MTYEQSLARHYADTRARLMVGGGSDDTPPEREVVRVPLAYYEADPPPKPPLRKQVLRTPMHLMHRLPGTTQWQRIVNEVAEKYDISAGAIIGTCRFYHIKDARQEVYWRIRNEVTIGGTPASYPIIGKWIGGRDHTTVLHGIRKHEERMRDHSA
jgi:hypothetical protein